MGTDLMGMAPIDHGLHAMELGLLVSDIGLSTMEAIVAATSTSPAALAIQDSTGTLEASKKAELLVVSRNPLEDIKGLEDGSAFERVYVGGKRLK
ncbi:amidohydrolase family protein [Paenibacillus thiaminolyticus]|uniref:amidohydrolase family protein n=1 Tax=Paenibacillus thiaminolyticus TaxID=49283 RepID=UPI0025438880|nr:amidohydrolase family protein [Paenibacillus thiaminolyticus]WII39930.1 amidohydrolase family protein [Paenibacillus thiaminolyticus]